MVKENRIAELMGTRKLYQYELAERAGITPDRLNHYIHGRKTPNVYTAIAIAQALGVPVEKVWGQINDA